MFVGNLAPNSKQKYALRHYTSASPSNQERDSIEVLCKKHMIHSTQLNLWKKEFIANSSVVFEKEYNRIESSKDDLIQVLYAQIRGLKVANDFLKKKAIK